MQGVSAAVAIVVTMSIVGIFLNYIPYILGITGVAFATVVTIKALGRPYIIQSLIRKPTVANVRSLM